MKVGLHGRNDVTWPQADIDIFARANIEAAVMMSFTDLSVFERLRAKRPNIEFIIRLYDDRLKQGHTITPQQFTAKMLPLIRQLKPFARKFQVHNEPNHVAGIEGWGATEKDADSFASWYAIVLDILREKASWASIGFPGLAMPNFLHHDNLWLHRCAEVITRSDWLGCHAYWQYENMLDPYWGKTFIDYHYLFPHTTIEITEFGNSTPDLKPEKMAHDYKIYYTELQKYQYVNSASAFIESSPDPTWEPFAWRTEGGIVRPVVDAVAGIPRNQQPAPNIINYIDALKNNPNTEWPYEQRSLLDIKRLIVHHSATPNTTTVRRIHQYHKNTNGWQRIGYHLVIVPDGTIYKTNEYETISFHSYKNNSDSIGICLIGNFTRRHPTDAQKESLRMLLAHLSTTLGVKRKNIKGHKEVVKTACPGATWKQWKQEVLPS